MGAAQAHLNFIIVCLLTQKCSRGCFCVIILSIQSLTIKCGFLQIMLSYQCFLSSYFLFVNSLSIFFFFFKSILFVLNDDIRILTEPFFNKVSHYSKTEIKYWLIIVLIDICKLNIELYMEPDEQYVCTLF